MDAARDENAGEPVLLLVEDNPDDVLLIRRALRKLGLLVNLVVLEDGEAAVAYLDGHAGFADRRLHPVPQVVLLDLKLPRRSGHEVLEWIRAQAHLDTTPVVVLTSSNEDEDLLRAYRGRANSYLRKPVAFDALASLVALIHHYWLRANVTPTMQPIDPDPT